MEFHEAEVDGNPWNSTEYGIFYGNPWISMDNSMNSRNDFRQGWQQLFKM
jgi:hypothetical protein